jgi:multidrug resistance efflux pump
MCSAESYQITGEELNSLNSIYDQLQSNLEKQDRLLLMANERLIASDQTITRLSNQLTKAEILINQTQNSLQKANESLEKLRKEERAKIRKAKIERDIAILVAAYFAAR